MTIVVRELLIYPVKSCAGFQVNEAQTTRYGLALPSNPLLSDRRWMIVKEARQRNQIQIPRMALIRPSFTQNSLQLDAPGMTPLTIPNEPLPEEIIDIVKMSVKGRKYGTEVSNWLSTFLETPGLELVYFDEEFQPNHTKNIEPEFPNDALDSDVVGYQDVAQYHLGSLESIDDLNKRLKTPIKIHNFRPNIIVSGIDKPYGEDYWREIQIGGTTKLRWSRSCLRCLQTTINQTNGIRDPSQEPWKTLRTYRCKPSLYGKEAQFGTYLGPLENGLIRVGDSVRILREDPNF